MNVPADLRYSKEHEWIAVADGVGTVGITDHAQEELGDVEMHQIEFCRRPTGYVVKC